MVGAGGSVTGNAGRGGGSGGASSHGATAGMLSIAPSGGGPGGEATGGGGFGGAGGGGGGGGGGGVARMCGGGIIIGGAAGGGGAPCLLQLHLQLHGPSTMELDRNSTRDRRIALLLPRKSTAALALAARRASDNAASQYDAMCFIGLQYGESY